VSWVDVWGLLSPAQQPSAGLGLHAALWIDPIGYRTLLLWNESDIAERPRPLLLARARISSPVTGGVADGDSFASLDRSWVRIVTLKRGGSADSRVAQRSRETSAARFNVTQDARSRE
jgi:hypothetical protein